MSEITLDQIAQRLGVTRRTAHRYAREAGLQPVRFTGRHGRTAHFTGGATEVIQAHVLTRKLRNLGYAVATAGIPTMKELRAERARAKGGRR